ncbi:MAG: hypothetical protein SH847_07240 [Roseiflexaceae bacterium]|nr:hypothetical protein [Roseiflexaceae bacterium]
MPIRRAELRINLLRVGGDATAVGAFQALAKRPASERWLLLIDLGPARYGILGIADLARFVEQIQANPETPLHALTDACLPIDADDDDLAAIRLHYDALLQQGKQLNRHVIVLRGDQPIGAVEIKRATGVGVLSTTTDTILNMQAAPGSNPQQLEQRTDRYVNTNFTALDLPRTRLDPGMPLAPRASYYFRFWIGVPSAESIEQQPTQIQAELLTSDIELVVILFSEDFVLEAHQGTIFVPVHGATHIKTAASLPDGMTAATSDGYLFFRVQTPAQTGIATLRCSIYCNGMQIQSRLVSAVVAAGVPVQALDDQGLLRRSVLDFNLSSSLAPQVLGSVQPHVLSLMLNSNSDGTHSFRVAANDGQELFSSSATLSPTALANLVDLARQRLHEAAWGNAGEYTPQSTYRYDTNTPLQTRLQYMRSDLIDMAKRGAILYNSAIKDIANGKQKSLRQIMQKPGMVQLASKMNASDIVPIALFYDALIDSLGSPTICPQFEQSLAKALEQGTSLIDEPCFTGNCPSSGDLSIVCPSGFWGFRQDIGMPYPVRPGGPELATRIGFVEKPQIGMAYFSDFPLLKGHLEHLGTLNAVLSEASPRKDVLALLQKSTPQLVYFYCHGAEINTIPLIRVGAESGAEYIATDNFANFAIDWPEQRPLVFINGCHTTALTPDKAISFVKTFMEDTSASGVIGTEITIFEPLAQTFAEAFFQHFLAGVPLGRAIRMARLALLAQGNPLGLVYLPFAYAGLRMTQT